MQNTILLCIRIVTYPAFEGTTYVLSDVGVVVTACRVGGEERGRMTFLQGGPKSEVTPLVPSRTGPWTVRRHWLQAPKMLMRAGWNSCASREGLVLSFIACFILLVIAHSGDFAVR